MKISRFFLVGLIFFTSCKQIEEYVWIENAVSVASFQTKLLTTRVDSMNSDTAIFPRSIRNGKLRFEGKEDWTSGFFPGTLWRIFELTNENIIKTDARRYTNKLHDIQYLTNTHDLGFMMYCSYGNAYRLAPEKGDDTILVNSARSLKSRFNPVTGTIRSWDFPEWNYPVIIDNMMNLEMLYWAGNFTKDSSFNFICKKHADTTLKNHFRDDFSSYHVVDYNSQNGGVLARKTFQGYADSSSWARGQAWGVYGYTVCYRETKDERYLKQAKSIASYIMQSVTTDDLIPYWDYDAPNIPNAPRDASAAAVTAAGFLELSKYVENGNIYIDYADKILRSLASEKYLAKKGTNSGYILMHSVGSFPHNSEVDVPLNYADYYFMEALIRYLEVKNIDKKTLKYQLSL